MSRYNDKGRREGAAGGSHVSRGREDQVDKISRRIALVAFPDFEPLDVTGPFSVFAGTAAAWAEKIP